MPGPNKKQNKQIKTSTYKRMIYNNINNIYKIITHNTTIYSRPQHERLPVLPLHGEDRVA